MRPSTVARKSTRARNQRRASRCTALSRVQGECITRAARDDEPEERAYEAISLTSTRGSIRALCVVLYPDERSLRSAQRLASRSTSCPAVSLAIVSCVTLSALKGGKNAAFARKR